MRRIARLDLSLFWFACCDFQYLLSIYLSIFYDGYGLIFLPRQDLKAAFGRDYCPKGLLCGRVSKNDVCLCVCLMSDVCVCVTIDRRAVLNDKTSLPKVSSSKRDPKKEHLQDLIASFQMSRHPISKDVRIRLLAYRWRMWRLGPEGEMLRMSYLV